MLGNVVSQLHIHVVLRKIDDAAWPGPVWGREFTNLEAKFGKLQPAFQRKSRL